MSRQILTTQIVAATLLTGPCLLLPASALAQSAAAKPALTGVAFNAKFEDIQYKAAVYVDDGKFVAEKSGRGEVSGGNVTGNSATGLKIVVRDDQTNGLYVRGKSDFTLTNSSIEVFGNSAGWDENFGIGAGATVGFGATLTLRNVTVTTAGLKAVPVAGAGGILRVYDSKLVAKGGELQPENRSPDSGPGYFGPPVPLNISGTARGSNVIGDGKAYYYNSTIIADGWGAMSTDSATPAVYLEINDCRVIVNNSGYGAYADLRSEVVANNTHFSSASDTGIISGNGKITLNNVTEDRAVNGVLLHAPGQDFLSVGTLNIRGGSYKTKEATILVKSHNANIVLDNVKLQPKNGVLLQSEVNDSKRSPLIIWLLNERKAANVTTTPAAGINTTFKNIAKLSGDIVHKDTTRTMTLNLEQTSLKGAITGTVWAINDISLKLDGGSSWTATRDSRVTLLGLTDTKQIDAPRGVTIIAIAGKGTTLEGHYKLAHGGELIVKKAS
ncbi:MAG: hypothetical protein QM756_29715 [Polyangiaceae bacterium]